jgi:hypothetical protein
MSKFSVLSTSERDFSHPGHRLLMSQAVLKTADLSHSCRPLKIQQRWLDKIAEELYFQGDLEKKENVEVITQTRNSQNYSK